MGRGGGGPRWERFIRDGCRYHQRDLGCTLIKATDAATSPGSSSKVGHKLGLQLGLATYHQLLWWEFTRAHVPLLLPLLNHLVGIIAAVNQSLGGAINMSKFLSCHLLVAILVMCLILMVAGGIGE